MQHAPIIVSVSALTHALKSHIEPVFNIVHVRGEISNIKFQASGHIYCSLIDEHALLNAVIFKVDAQKIPFPLKNGDTIIASGEISLYAPRGSYQLIIRTLTNVGLGDALLRLEALKKKLKTLGYFEKGRKRPLPSPIKTIGLITSPTGAVLHDIHTILSRRMGSFHLLIYPVKVQGETAASEISKAIEQFSIHRLADVVIICRGGGSSEDLSAFNTEQVAKACYESTIPLISAVGHETDLSITDLVCDLRAETPSAAAELVSFEKESLLRRCTEYRTTITSLLLTLLSRSKNQHALYEKRLLHIHPKKRLEHHFLHLDDLNDALQNAIARILHQKKQKIQQLKTALIQASITERLKRYKTIVQTKKLSIDDSMKKLLLHHKKRLLHQTSFLDSLIQKRLWHAKASLHAAEKEKRLLILITTYLAQLKEKTHQLFSHIDALNPTRILNRGYAILFSKKDHRPLHSITDVSLNDEVELRLHDGMMEAKVIRKMYDGHTII